MFNSHKINRYNLDNYSSMIFNKLCVSDIYNIGAYCVQCTGELVMCVKCGLHNVFTRYKFVITNR